MKRLSFLLPVLLAAIGCNTCDRPPPPPSPPPDAGAEAGRATMGATDLRSAVFLTLPDFTGTKVLEADASFERRSRLESEDLEATRAALIQSLEKKGWSIESGGEGRLVTATNPPFLLLARIEGARLTQTLRLPLGEDGVIKLYAAPVSQTTETLAARFGEVPATIEAQIFRFHVGYVTTIERASQLLVQQARRLADARWRLEGPSMLSDPDAGLTSLPDPSNIVLEEPPTGGRLELARAKGRVRVDYEQPISLR